MSLRAAFGWGALALFAGMAVVSWVWIRPVAGFLPQAAPGVSETQLAEFALALSQAKLADMYRAVVLVGDSAFIACFALWVALSVRGALGGGLALGYAGVDLSENYLLLSHFLLRSDDLTGVVLYLPAETGTWAPVAYLTAAKLAMAISLTIGILARDMRRRRDI